MSPAFNPPVRFTRLVLKAKCEPGEDLELLGEAVPALRPKARQRLRRRVAGVTPVAV